MVRPADAPPRLSLGRRIAGMAHFAVAHAVEVAGGLDQADCGEMLDASGIEDVRQSKIVVYVAHR